MIIGSVRITGFRPFNWTTCKMMRMELKKMRDKCLLFNQYMIKKGNLPVVLLNAFAESNVLIEKAYLEKNPKPLKALSRDIDNQVLKQMPLEMAKELKLLFEKELNINYDVVLRAQDITINRILKRAKILNEQEYRLMLDRVDANLSEGDKKHQVERMNNLLAAYQSKL